jgi:glutamate formiminotransferase
MASFVTRTAWQRALPLACCCKIYVSVNPSSNAEALEKIEAAARSQPEAPLLHVFEDHEYSRVGYTLAGSLLPGFRRQSGRLLPPLQIAVTEAVEAALESLDLRQHCGSHPRLGAVDHISLHPLGGVALQDVAPTARAIAQAIGSNFKVPVFLYGAAHATGRPLDELRRALGYFKTTNEQGLWTGSSSSSFPSEMQPDFGPEMQTAKTGVVIVGACPWIMNFNVPLLSQDLAAARRIARKLSVRGGGLPQVQAMALRHGETEIEIACNLLDCQISDPEIVQREVVRLAATENIEAKQGYTTGFTEDEVLKAAWDKLSSCIHSFPNP